MLIMSVTKIKTSRMLSDLQYYDTKLYVCIGVKGMLKVWGYIMSQLEAYDGFL